MDAALPVIRQAVQPTFADQVFDALQQTILTFELPLQTKISELDISKEDRDLRMLIDRQRAAIEAKDRNLFHALGERFHSDLWTMAGVPCVAALIQKSKAHLNRTVALIEVIKPQRHSFFQDTVE